MAPNPPPNGSPPTLKSLAQIAKVSTTTVSLALRNSSEVSPATREWIQALARDAGYCPNAFAASLRMLRTEKSHAHRGNLALLVGHRTDNPLENPKRPHYGEMAAGIRQRAEELGFSIDTFWVYDPKMNPARLHRVLQARSIQGLVLLQLHEIESGLPMEVYAAAYTTRLSIGVHYPFVSHDHYLGVAHAMEMALSLGYRRPGLATWPVHSLSRDRSELAAFAIMQSDLPAQNRVPVCVFEQARPGDHESETQSVVDWMEKHRPDVILSSSAHLRGWLENHGLSFPRDAGYINLELRATSDPSSGILPPWRSIGAKAVDIVTSRLHRNERGPHAEPGATILPFSWREGDSTPAH